MTCITKVQHEPPDKPPRNTDIKYLREIRRYICKENPMDIPAERRKHYPNGVPSVSIYMVIKLYINIYHVQSYEYKQGRSIRKKRK